jgi:hypothetical protein
MARSAIFWEATMFGDDEYVEFIRALSHRLRTEKRYMTDDERRQWMGMVDRRLRGLVPQPPDPFAMTPSYREQHWTIRHQADLELFWTVGAYWEIWGRHTLHRPERERIERELVRVEAEEPDFPGQLVSVEVIYRVGVGD